MKGIEPCSMAAPAAPCLGVCGGGVHEKTSGHCDPSEPREGLKRGAVIAPPLKISIDLEGSNGFTGTHFLLEARS
jgi:hypothetical protein